LHLLDEPRFAFVDAPCRERSQGLWTRRYQLDGLLVTLPLLWKSGVAELHSPAQKPMNSTFSATDGVVTRVLARLHDLCVLISSIALVVLILSFACLVFGRYVLNQTPTWIEQLHLACCRVDYLSWIQRWRSR
jgi:hypothetical protein